MSTVNCPHCGKKVELSEALLHEYVQKARNEEIERKKIEIEKAKVEAVATTEKKLKEDGQKELELAKKTTQDLKEKLDKVQANKEKDEARIKEDAKIEAEKKAKEENDLKFKEKEIQLEQAKKANEDIRKANEDLKRKLEQGSQQLQGEALELNFEEYLKKAFPNDEFLPVPKGVEGGDIWQKVKSQGKEVGSILWEAKRTKAWSNTWIGKLKSDASKLTATHSIIVSQAIPSGAKLFDVKDGIWITSFEYAIPLCRHIRILLSSIAKVKSSVAHTDKDLGKIRDYMMSDSFKNRMETHSYSVRNLRTLLESEKRSTQIRWKKQQSQIDKLESNNIEFYEELKDIVPDLPEFKNVDTPLLESGDEDFEESTKS